MCLVTASSIFCLSLLRRRVNFAHWPTVAAAESRAEGFGSRAVAEHKCFFSARDSGLLRCFQRPEGRTETLRFCCWGEGGQRTGRKCRRLRRLVRAGLSWEFFPSGLFLRSRLRRRARLLLLAVLSWRRRLLAGVFSGSVFCPSPEATNGERGSSSHEDELGLCAFDSQPLTWTVREVSVCVPPLALWHAEQQTHAQCERPRGEAGSRCLLEALGGDLGTSPV